MTEVKTVLVVDDEKAICNLIKAILESEGLRVISALNGEDGLKILKNTIPDLIILDMNMPKMSGIEFYSNIANPNDATPTIPVLVLTGRGNMKSMFESFNVDGFIAKPFKTSEFIETVKNILNKSKT